MRIAIQIVGLAIVAVCTPVAGRTAAPPRNVVIFVADGLRAGSVTAEDAPTMFAFARHGVLFSNSHAVVPTLTTPNAAAIATGHLPGDSGDFSNTLWPGFQVFDTGNFDRHAASPTPFVENDVVLGDLDDHFGGNWLGEDSLLSVARSKGYSTAAVGKMGPVGVQDVTQLAPNSGHLTGTQTIIIDDATGGGDGVPLDTEVTAALRAAGLPTATPARIQPHGDARIAGTRSPNWGQQVYFLEATTRAVLPVLRRRGRPFLLVYWSRDPDGTQHNQGDSLNTLRPGINGPTSKAAVRNADSNLQQILEALRAEPGLAANTDVLVTSDHGFATISKHDVDPWRRGTSSFAASLDYDDVPKGFLPPGFLAIDLAEHLRLPLYDPDGLDKSSEGLKYRSVYAGATAASESRQHSAAGHGLLGGTGATGPASGVRIIIAANGGSDLIYLPAKDPELLRQIADYLATRDYVGALFADDDYGMVPGALPLSAIGLRGATRLPTPALVVGFRSFLLDQREARGSGREFQNAVQVADTPLQQGQGAHGSFTRDNTLNFMAASGPDFKSGFDDRAPVGNADIAPTVAAILGWPWPGRGLLSGRVMDEARSQGHRSIATEICTRGSPPTADGQRTVLQYQRAADRVYVDAASFERNLQFKEGCHARR